MARRLTRPGPARPGARRPRRARQPAVRSPVTAAHHLSDRDRLLLAFANLSRHGIAARAGRDRTGQDALAACRLWAAKAARRLGGDPEAAAGRADGVWVLESQFHDAFTGEGELTGSLTVTCHGDSAAEAAQAALAAQGLSADVMAFGLLVTAS